MIKESLYQDCEIISKWKSSLVYLSHEYTKKIMWQKYFTKFNP